jgi:hypothetical protein
MRLFIGPIALLALTSGCIIDHTDGSAGYGGDTYYYSNDCSSGGSANSGGTTSAGGGVNANGGGAGGAGAEAGAAGAPAPPPPPPTCAELPDEVTCELRADCQPIYAGTDCSCGPNCTCFDGAEGCTCEHFGYVTCIALDPPAAPSTR